MKLGGGEPGIILAVKEAGKTPGPLMVWFGSWTLGDYAAVDRACSGAKGLGVPLLAQLWFGGDQLNHDFLTKPEGTWDEHQKKMKNRGQAMAFFSEVGSRIGKSNVEAIVVIETEFNKNGIEKDPALADYLQAAMASIRTAAPKAKVALAPGDWQDLYVLASQTMKDTFAKADVLGARTMRGGPHSKTAADIVGGADALLKAAMALHRAWPQKPIVITDFAVGTYGGPDISSTKPYGSKADPAKPPPASAFSFFDAAQKQAFEKVKTLALQFASAGVDTIVYRGLKDAANVGLTNHYGYGERTFGVVRADGVHKPGYYALMDLAGAVEPVEEPKTRTEAEYKGVVEERDRALFARDKALDEASQSRMAADRLRAQVERARTSVNAAQAALDGP